MKVIALGKVTVPAAGTPVGLLSVLPASVSLGSYNSVRGILVRSFSGNTGKVYFGGSALNVASKNALIAELLVPAANGQSDSCLILAEEGDMVDLSTFAVDAAVNGEGPLVSVFL